jgi:glycosyltransferase involved in cell wall biosynthesis
VYDNNSSDETIAKAEAAGAVVRKEALQGKGNVVRRMFADIEADVYVVVDGDDTYDPLVSEKMVIMLLEERLDMVNGFRITEDKEAYRVGHKWGNRFLTGIVRWVFGDTIKDMLSGYRVFSRRFVKSFPALSHGFEIETELTVHALELHMPIVELPTYYKSRPEGSLSKLHTIRDGIRILRMIFALVKNERPLMFFSVIFVFLSVASVGMAIPIIVEFMETGLVPRFPTAILSPGVMLLAFLSLAAGLILDTVATARKELRRLHYLSHRAPGS